MIIQFTVSGNPLFLEKLWMDSGSPLNLIEIDISSPSQNGHKGLIDSLFECTIFLNTIAIFKHFQPNRKILWGRGILQKSFHWMIWSSLLSLFFTTSLYADFVVSCSYFEKGKTFYHSYYQSEYIFYKSFRFLKISLMTFPTHSLSIFHKSLTIIFTLVFYMEANYDSKSKIFHHYQLSNPLFHR